jgi:hypothetical protein
MGEFRREIWGLDSKREGDIGGEWELYFASALRSAIVFSLHLVASVMAIPSAAGADQEGA